MIRSFFFSGFGGDGWCTIATAAYPPEKRRAAPIDAPTSRRFARCESIEERDQASSIRAAHLPLAA